MDMKAWTWQKCGWLRLATSPQLSRFCHKSFRLWISLSENWQVTHHQPNPNSCIAEAEIEPARREPQWPGRVRLSAESEVEISPKLAGTPGVKEIGDTVKCSQSLISLAENGVSEDGGEFFMEAGPESFYMALLQFSQAVSKVCNMRYFKREVLASLFEELLAEFIQAELQRFKPSPTTLPIPDRDDLEVD